MTSIRLAASIAAAASLVLASCANTTGPQQAAEQTNSCLGVAPATGTSLVRKADCGVRPQQAVGPSGQPHVDVKKQ